MGDFASRRLALARTRAAVRGFSRAARARQTEKRHTGGHTALPFSSQSTHGGSQHMATSGASAEFATARPRSAALAAATRTVAALSRCHVVAGRIGAKCGFALGSIRSRAITSHVAFLTACQLDSSLWIELVSDNA